jgi:hypothetical protein
MFIFGVSGSAPSEEPLLCGDVRGGGVSFLKVLCLFLDLSVDRSMATPSRSASMLIDVIKLPCGEGARFGVPVNEKLEGVLQGRGDLLLAVHRTRSWFWPD